MISVRVSLVHCVKSLKNDDASSFFGAGLRIPSRLLVSAFCPQLLGLGVLEHHCFMMSVPTSCLTPPSTSSLQRRGISGSILGHVQITRRPKHLQEHPSTYLVPPASTVTLPFCTALAKLSAPWGFTWRKGDDSLSRAFSFNA